MPQSLESLQFVLSQLRARDLLDIVLVWMVVYRVLILIRRTGTLQILSGLGILAIGYVLSIWLELFTFNWLLEKFFSNLFVIIVVLFQAEIRRALAHIGANPFLTGNSSAQETQIIEEIVQGAQSLAQHGYGALIVIEKDILVDYHVEFGTEIDAKISSEILLSIFHPSSPVHDGAVVVRGGKIQSAGTFLPLSKNSALDKNLGTRHRSALGLTEETDALVIVISEETKKLGWATGGILHLDADSEQLRRVLYEVFELKYRGRPLGSSLEGLS